MMKQLDFWPLALKLAQPARMLCAPSVGAEEQESRAYELHRLSHADYLGYASVPLVDISLGPKPRRYPKDMLLTIVDHEFFRITQNIFDKHKSDGSQNDLVSQQLNLPLLEYCMCHNQKARIGRYEIAQGCIEAECCVALLPE